MKEKIIIFAIGLLVGAVMVTGAFCVYTVTSNSSNCNKRNVQTQSMTPPDMNNNSGGQMGGQNNGQPPEKPSDNNMQSSSNQEQNNSN